MRISYFAALSAFLVFAIVCGNSYASEPGGCFGQTLDTCISSLQRNPMWKIDEFKLGLEEKRYTKVDVNGKRIKKPSDHDFRVSGVVSTTDGRFFPDDAAARISITLELNNQDVVTRITGSLIFDPMYANTAEEYDQTKLYDTASIILYGECASLDRLGLYKLFQDQIKSTLKPGIDKFTNPESINVRKSKHSAELPLCGHKLSYSALYVVTPNPGLPIDDESRIAIINFE